MQVDDATENLLSCALDVLMHAVEVPSLLQWRMERDIKRSLSVAVSGQSVLAVDNFSRLVAPLMLRDRRCCAAAVSRLCVLTPAGIRLRGYNFIRAFFRCLQCNSLLCLGLSNSERFGEARQHEHLLSEEDTEWLSKVVRDMLHWTERMLTEEKLLRQELESLGVTDIILCCICLSTVSHFFS